MTFVAADGALRARSDVAAIWAGRNVQHLRGAKVGVMPAEAGIHLSAAPLYDAGFPLSRE